MVRAQKQGISLIVLIVTIIVIIILAAVVILTLTKNNPIESAKEARFKEDIRTFQDELAMTVSKQYANAGGKRDTKINADKYTKDGAEDSVYTYIPSFKDKYNGKFVIQDDELRYTRNLEDKEVEFLSSLNVKKYSIFSKEFQQVEYLESTGTQWIDTKIIPNNNLKGEFNLMCKGDTGYPFGSTNGQNIDYWGINFYGFGINNFECYLGSGSYPKVSHWEKDIKYNIIIDKKKFFCDGNLIYDFTNSTNNFDFNTTKTIYLFGLNYNGGSFWPFRIYNAKFWNDDKLIHDFVPCYSTVTVTDVDGKRLPAGTIGMYDTVEETFYTNQGTGKFDVGPNV